jgi:hypothetical protein
MTISNTSLTSVDVVDAAAARTVLDQLNTMSGLLAPVIALQDRYKAGSITTGSTGITATNTVQFQTQGCGAALFRAIPSSADLTFVFLGSLDGTNFFPIPAYPQDGTSGLFGQPVNGVLDLGTSTTYYVPCAGYNVIAVSSSSTYNGEFTSGSVAFAAEASIGQVPSAAIVPVVPNTFRGCVAAWAAANVLTTKDFMQLQGSATKIVRLRRVSGAMLLDGTNVGSVNFWLNRRTATFSGGTIATVTCVANDVGAAASLSPTQTAVLKTTTASSTNGAGSGLVAAQYVGDDSTSTLGGVTSVPFEFDFRAAPLVLRGTADFLALGVGATGAPTTSVFDFAWEFDEAAI